MESYLFDALYVIVTITHVDKYVREDSCGDWQAYGSAVPPGQYVLHISSDVEISSFALTQH